jgi:hypothetical protein
MESLQWPKWLSRELYLEIREFDRYSYQRLLRCSKELFQQVKFETQFLPLGKENSRRFQLDESFHSLTLTKIQDPKLQLSLRLHAGTGDGSYDPLQDSFQHHFPLSCYSVRFEGIECLHAEKTFLHLTELTLRSCDRTTNINVLGHLQKIVVSDCRAFCDVSRLGNVRHLRIFHCSALTDISSLTNNYDLAINRCENLLKEQSLPSFQNCVGVDSDLITTNSDLDYLPHVKYFKPLHVFESLSEKLKSLKVLSLFCCVSLTKLIGVRNIPRIEMLYCDLLDDISEITNTTVSVSISGCPRLTNFQPLLNIKNVEIINCNGFKDGFQVEKVKRLYISQCQGIEDVSMLGNVQRLELANCKYIRSFEGLERVPELIISGLTESPTLESIKRENRRIVLKFKTSPILIPEFGENYDRVTDDGKEFVYLKKRDVH